MQKLILRPSNPAPAPSLHSNHADIRKHVTRQVGKSNAAPNPASGAPAAAVPFSASFSFPWSLFVAASGVGALPKEPKDPPPPKGGAVEVAVGAAGAGVVAGASGCFDAPPNKENAEVDDPKLPEPPNNDVPPAGAARGAGVLALGLVSGGLAAPNPLKPVDGVMDDGAAGVVEVGAPVTG